MISKVSEVSNMRIPHNYLICEAETVVVILERYGQCEYYVKLQAFKKEIPC